MWMLVAHEADHKDWNFQSHHCQTLRRDEGLQVKSVANGRWVDQQCPCNGASTKLKRMGFRGLLNWWAHGDLRRVKTLGRTRELVLLPVKLTLCIPSIWPPRAVSFKTNQGCTEWNASLNYVNYSHKLIKPDKEVVETSGLQPLGEKYR